MSFYVYRTKGRIEMAGTTTISVSQSNKERLDAIGQAAFNTESLTYDSVVGFLIQQWGEDA